VRRILAISGSLRQRSSNTELLRAFALLAAPALDVSLETGLGELPHFNPDLEGREPDAVMAFRGRLRDADAVVISSPEYAHGIVGALKDALDWVVGSGEFSGKPVALFNASPRASLAHESLAEVVRTMDAKLIVEAGLHLPLLGKNLDAKAIAENPEMAAAIRTAIEALVRAIAAADVSGTET
jgi:NAD(P)H-dependent FMN reductase